MFISIRGGTHDLQIDIIEGKRVLELGSGVGFLGIIAASLQQLSSRNTPSTSPSIWLTDANEEVLTLCRRNVQLPCSKTLFIRVIA